MPTRPRICRPSSQAAASSTGTTWNSTRSKIIHCQIYSCRCFSAWGSTKIASPRPLEQCAVWKRECEMKRIAFLFWLLASVVVSGASDEVVIDFEQADIGKPMTNWVEKGVVFALAHQLKQSKAAGR